MEEDCRCELLTGERGRIFTPKIKIVLNSQFAIGVIVRVSYD